MSEIQTNPAIQRYNDALIQKSLNRYEKLGFTEQLALEGIGSVDFYEVPGISRFWDEDEETSTLEMMTQVITGMADNNAIFILLLTGTPNGIRLRVGADKAAAQALENGMRAVYKGIEIKPCDVNDLREFSQCIGGVMTGCVSASNEKERRKKTVSRCSATR